MYVLLNLLPQNLTKPIPTKITNHAWAIFGALGRLVVHDRNSIMKRDLVKWLKYIFLCRVLKKLLDGKGVYLLDEISFMHAFPAWADLWLVLVVGGWWSWW